MGLVDWRLWDFLQVGIAYILERKVIKFWEAIEWLLEKWLKVYKPGKTIIV